MSLMSGSLDANGTELRCERCNATIVQEGLCPACLLRDGLELDLALDPDAPGGFDAPFGCESHEGVPVIEGYEIQSELGRGGMGIVYLAEQTRPVRRRVALKLIKLGMDTKKVIARFEAERQALALMEHR